MPAAAINDDDDDCNRNILIYFGVIAIWLPGGLW
jgi:hypothetical protein